MRFILEIIFLPIILPFKVIGKFFEILGLSLFMWDITGFLWGK